MEIYENKEIIKIIQQIKIKGIKGIFLMFDKKKNVSFCIDKPKKGNK